MTRKTLPFLIALLALFMTSLDAHAQQSAEDIYLQKVIDYAETMLADGRDDERYGPETSPMFSVFLRRETNALPAFPAFNTTSGETFSDLDFPGAWSYRAFTNIPMMSKKNPDNWNHGQDKAHKQTVTGADPLENGGMYLAFQSLSVVTGDSKYVDAVRESLNWFSDKQSAKGLYPFGEHSGWDFRYDSPAYLTTINADIPYTWHSPDDAPLYHAWLHEPNGAYEKFAPFYAYLMTNHPDRFKAYARGLWEEHFWDKENGFYNRHGDIYIDELDGWGMHEDDLYGSFPRMTRIFAEVWTDAYLAYPDDAEFQADMVFYLNKLIDGRILDVTNNDGSIPFDRRSGSKNPYIPRQYLSMNHGVEDAANRLAAFEPALAAKMASFADQQWGWFFPWVVPANGYQGTDWASEYALGDIYSVQYAHDELHQPENGLEHTRLDDMYWYFADALEDGSVTMYDNNARSWATAIDYMVNAYHKSGDSKYLNKAQAFADWTLDNYFDETSALPKAVSFGVEGVSTLTTTDGQVWQPPYDAQMGSADLMNALINLYAAMTEIDLENGQLTSTTPDVPLAIGLDSAEIAQPPPVLLLGTALLLTAPLIVWRKIG